MRQATRWRMNPRRSGGLSSSSSPCRRRCLPPAVAAEGGAAVPRGVRRQAISACCRTSTIRRASCTRSNTRPTRRSSSTASASPATRGCRPIAVLADDARRLGGDRRLPGDTASYCAGAVSGRVAGSRTLQESRFAAPEARFDLAPRPPRIPRHLAGRLARAVFRDPRFWPALGQNLSVPKPVGSGPAGTEEGAILNI